MVRVKKGEEGRDHAIRKERERERERDETGAGLLGGALGGGGSPPCWRAQWRQCIDNKHGCVVASLLGW